MSQQIESVQLCQRCEELFKSRGEDGVCDDCKIECLRIWQNNALALKGEQYAV